MCGATIGVGVLLALLHVRPAGVMALVVLVLPVAVAMGTTPAVRERFSLDETAAVLRFGAAVVAVVLSACGVAAAFGAAGIAMWLLVLAGGWVICSQRAPQRIDLEARLRARPGRPSASGFPIRTPGTADAAGLKSGADLLRPPVSELSGSELCWAWRNSYVAAQQATGDPDRLDRVSRRRQQYLDEIQRRDPDGFTAWLNAGARAASDPGRYVRLSDRSESRPGSSPAFRPPDGPADG